jgi:hypothetical protein
MSDPTFCKHLRTKTLYVGASPLEAFAEKEGEHETPCHVWCNLTQTETGPDDGPVHKHNCQRAERSCFET